jgi:hypothetical protein
VKAAKYIGRTVNVGGSLFLDIVYIIPKIKLCKYKEYDKI